MIIWKPLCWVGRLLMTQYCNHKLKKLNFYKGKNKHKKSRINSAKCNTCMYLHQNNIRSSSIQMTQLKNVQVIYFYNFGNCNIFVAFFVSEPSYRNTLFFQIFHLEAFKDQLSKVKVSGMGRERPRPLTPALSYRNTHRLTPQRHCLPWGTSNDNNIPLQRTRGASVLQTERTQPWKASNAVSTEISSSCMDERKHNLKISFS